MLSYLLLLALLFSCPTLVFTRHLPWSGWHNEVEGYENCPPCQEEKCPSVPQRCPAGRVRDRCGCCWMCANVEGQMCDLPWEGYNFGACGDGLLCQVKAGHSEEPQCVCTMQESVCGTDRRTYRNRCRLQEAAMSKRRTELHMVHTGPCQQAPSLLSSPRDTVALTGQSVILGCEVSGQPLAELEWKKEGSEGTLPGESSHMIVQTRGGPQRHQVTGWLQIHRVREGDAGLYICRAWNSFGEVSASAKLKVIAQDSPLASEVFSQRVGVFDVTDDDDDDDRSLEGSSGLLP
ncbi:kazal-type serine protease inhibitor domain-containing protein 1-like [Rhinophrynus dorsalis]